MLVSLACLISFFFFIVPFSCVRLRIIQYETRTVYASTNTHKGFMRCNTMQIPSYDCAHCNGYRLCVREGNQSLSNCVAFPLRSAPALGCTFNPSDLSTTVCLHTCANVQQHRKIIRYPWSRSEACGIINKPCGTNAFNAYDVL